MPVVVVEPPLPVVTLNEAKLHCRVDTTDTVSDSLIQAYIAAATAWIDGPTGWLGRAIGVQILEWRSCGWPCDDFTLPFPPLIEVISISYMDAEGVLQTLPIPDPWTFDDAPSTRGREGDVRIRYRAGYGASDEEDPPTWENVVPAQIKVAILMLVGHWYENRQAVISGPSLFSVPLGVEALLSTFRVWGV